MVREKYLQTVIDVIRNKGCATRRLIIEELLRLDPDMGYRRAERAADEVIDSLLRRGIIVRKGRGVYCFWPR
jgi:DNA polymerase elongation subunit (family B)